jgi:hypothetical protein
MAYARIFQARLIGHIHGQQTVNVINFGSNENPADASALATVLAQLATQIILCVTSTLIGGVTQDWTAETVEARQIYPTPSDPSVASFGAGTAGGGGTSNVSFAAVLCVLRTGGGGKRGRGRFFLPPPGDSAMTQSVLSDTTTGDFYRSFITCMTNKWVGSGHTENQELVVLSRKTISEGTPGVNAARPVTAMEINAGISCLRSRKVGHGS